MLWGTVTQCVKCPGDLISWQSSLENLKKNNLRRLPSTINYFSLFLNTVTLLSSRKLWYWSKKSVENENWSIGRTPGVTTNWPSFRVGFFAFIYTLILSRVLSRAVTSLVMTHYNANYDATSWLWVESLVCSLTSDICDRVQVNEAEGSVSTYRPRNQVPYLKFAWTLNFW